jgi:general secretion pathway protein K
MSSGNAIVRRSVRAAGQPLGRPQAGPAPSGGSGARQRRSVGVNGTAAGPPQGRPNPLGGQRPAKRRSVGARHLQRGAALLLAMLVVTLVATLTSAALWQQWRATTIEAAERQRAQAGWILTGSLDWARLILREDARGNRNSGNADHLGEPWATPLEEARMSSFLAADKNNNIENTLQSFLSGEIVDMQSRINFMNVVVVRQNDQGTEIRAEVSEPDRDTLMRLYQALGLPESELSAAINELVRTRNLAASDPLPSASALVPIKFAQLGWLGISQASLAALEPHLSVLPTRTTLNLNTASLQALSASIPGLDAARAQRLVSERGLNPFKTVAKAAQLLDDGAVQLSDLHHGTRSQFFEIRGRLRLDNTVIEERSLVERQDLNVSVRWRERLAAR